MLVLMVEAMVKLLGSLKKQAKRRSQRQYKTGRPDRLLREERLLPDRHPLPLCRSTSPHQALCFGFRAPGGKLEAWRQTKKEMARISDAYLRYGAGRYFQ
jgi:hypothetical protein